MGERVSEVIDEGGELEWSGECVPVDGGADFCKKSIRSANDGKIQP